MRDIKFRAWKKNEQEWFKPIYEAYEGKLYDISITMNGMVMERTLAINASMINNGNYILEQFTGLKDKNRIDIYEGDILSNGFNCKGEVIFKNGMFLVNFIYNESVCSKDNDTMTSRLISVNSVTEVIGNIYEHSYLLK